MEKRMAAKPVVEALTAKCAKDIEKLKAAGCEAVLAVVRVGQREDDLAYERGIKKRFEAAGAQVRVFEFDEDVSQERMERALKELDGDKDIHGILLFRPLPKSLDENILRNLVSPEKDVDCMSDVNMARVFSGNKDAFPPCTPAAVMEMLKFYGVELKGKKAVVIGRSMVVGKPLSMLLLGENATVTVCHTKTVDLRGECLAADIICAAAGSAKMVKADYVREGQIVMDVGINVVDGQLCGDVDYDGVEPLAAGITPVPGGVGSVTTSVLLKHVVASALKAGANALIP